MRHQPVEETIWQRLLGAGHPGRAALFIQRGGALLLAALLVSVGNAMLLSPFYSQYTRPTRAEITGHSTGPVTGYQAGLAASRATPTPFQPRALTPTPFRPLLHPTRTPEPFFEQTHPPAAQDLSPEISGIDFSPENPEITLRILPQGAVNGGNPIEIRFIPGERCQFGDHHACVYVYPRQNGGKVIFLTLHSGVGGEGQAFRHALEGTGLNRASFSLERVHANLETLTGAKVHLLQGRKNRKGFTIAALGRIPPGEVQAYFAAPVEEALSRVSDAYPPFDLSFDPAIDLIVFETCGWRMPGEPWAPGVSDTTGSVYVAVIH